MENTVVASAVSLLFCKFNNDVCVVLLLTYVYVRTVLYLTSAQQERCGSIGYNDETAATPSRTQLFYLNTANPAPCTGNITSWRVCYYGPNNIDSAGSYWAIYAVYRRMGSGSNVSFVRVSEIFRAVRTISRFTGDPVVDGEIAQGGFNCYNDSLDSPLTIQVGDILGACVFNPNNIPFVVTRLQLDVVGVASGESLLQMGTADCSMEAIPSNIPANQLSTVSSRRLHIYANISKLC